MAGAEVRQVAPSSDSTARSIERHNQVVGDISARVKYFYERKEKFRIFHGSTNSTRPFSAKGKNLVDTSRLSNVLKVDTEKRTVLVEPNVPMDRLVERTLKYGLVPPVVMEFPGITVGGGYAGTSGESSSFKHGFFNETMNYVEMVLANGDVVICSDKERPDLFHGAAGAVGTLGVTTLVELQLHDAKEFVETTYHPVSSIAEAVQKIERLTKDTSLDYIDGILFSKTSGALITGRFTDSPSQDLPIQRFSGASDPWFYLHVRDIISRSSGPTSEAIPLADYLFRYDRGGFWVGTSAFDYFKMPFTKLTRWLLDPVLHTREMYTALHASGESKRYIIQDLALPYSAAAEFIDYTHDAFNIYPLWLCPLRALQGPSIHPHLSLKHLTESKDTIDPLQPQPMLNIGLWGQGPTNHSTFIALNRDLEAKLLALHGRKWLYAHSYYTEDEFWAIYDRAWYEGLRAKYGASGLPSVFEKVRIDVEAERQAAAAEPVWRKLLRTRPLAGLYGVSKALQSKAYVTARASAWKKMGSAGG